MPTSHPLIRSHAFCSQGFAPGATPAATRKSPYSQAPGEIDNRIPTTFPQLWKLHSISTLRGNSQTTTDGPRSRRVFSVLCLTADLRIAQKSYEARASYKLLKLLFTTSYRNKPKTIPLVKHFVTLPLSTRSSQDNLTTSD